MQAGTKFQNAGSAVNADGLHGGFVFGYGLIVLGLLVCRVADASAAAWLMIPLGVLVFNFGEYTVHRHFGHHKYRIGALFCKRQHHSFFAESKSGAARSQPLQKRSEVMRLNGNNALTHIEGSFLGECDEHTDRD